MRLTFLFPPKRKMRTRGKGTARAQLTARMGRGVTPLGSTRLPGPDILTPRAYKRSKRVWP